MRTPALALRVAFAWFVLAAAAFVHAQEAALPDGAERVTSVEGITEYRLANGLRVLLFPDPSKATITVNVTYLVGSVHESYGETGMAHLLEHMLFKGSSDHPNILSELQNRGAQFNGTTAWDRTNYFETFDASDENLEWALGLEADRMVNAFIAKEDLDSEMTVVRNEFEAGENNPSRVLFERVLSTAYVWHGYGNSPIGSRSDIENVPIERLQAFYRKFYQPDNAVLVVAGRIDEARTIELVAKHFGAIPRPERVIEDNYTVEPTQDGEREVTVRRVGDIQLLAAAYHAPAGADPDFVPLQIAVSILTDAPSGRLYKALVEAGLAAQVGSQELQLRDPGMVILLALVRQDASLEAAREAMFAVIDGLANEPITEEELERTRNQILSSLEQQMNDSRGIALQLSTWASIGDWRLLFLDRDRVRAVTTDDVQRAALKYLKASNRTVGRFIPGNPDRTEIAARPDLVSMLEGYQGDEARSQGEAFDPSPANIDARTTRVTLPSGIKLALLPKETRGDVVNATIRLNFGNEENLRGQARIAPLSAQMLMRGTANRTRQQIQDELARLQSQLSVGGGAGAAVANIQSTRANLPQVLALAFEVLREPAFPEGELETLRSQLIAGLESSRSDPQAITQRAFARHFAQNYGPDDVRYSPSVEEQLEFATSVTLEQLREFHSRFFGASNAEVAVVGDFDAAQIQALVEQGLGDWTSPQPYAEILSGYPSPPIAPVDQKFETPDKENAFFLAGMPIRMTDEHPDYPALVIGNYLFGQGPASRLFSRIRGTEGLSYGVGSQFGADKQSDGARFVVNAIAAPQNAPRVAESFRDELAKVLETGYGTDELETSKRSWQQSRQVARSQDGALVGLLLGGLHDERTMAWHAALEERVVALNTSDVRDAMRRYLNIDAMTFMMGGDFAAAAPP